MKRIRNIPVCPIKGTRKKSFIVVTMGNLFVMRQRYVDRQGMIDKKLLSKI